MKRTRKHLNSSRLAIALMAVGLLGLVVRLTVRDRWIIFAQIFYGLPPLADVVLLALSTVMFLRQRRKRFVVAATVGLVLGVALWIKSDYVNTVPQDRVGEGLRIVFWNICHPSKKNTTFIPTLKQANGQIIVLAESGGSDSDRRRFWGKHFPGYQVSLLGGGQALLSKYPVSNALMYEMGRHARIGVYDLDTPFGTISIVAPDLPSNPFVSRRPYIDKTYELAAARSHPTIVLGDFNTPHSSVLFNVFRQAYKNAFEEAGNGFITTWPAIFPVLALDHIWLSEGFVPQRTWYQRTIHSDHVLVAADVFLREDQNQPTEEHQ